MGGKINIMNCADTLEKSKCVTAPPEVHGDSGCGKPRDPDADSLLQVQTAGWQAFSSLPLECALGKQKLPLSPFVFWWNHLAVWRYSAHTYCHDVSSVLLPPGCRERNGFPEGVAEKKSSLVLFWNSADGKVQTGGDICKESARAWTLFDFNVFNCFYSFDSFSVFSCCFSNQHWRNRTGNLYTCLKLARDTRPQ